jgi:tRNA A-37 threonylcarbamoyl transferase component Bud32
MASRGLASVHDFLAFVGGELVSRSRTTATRTFEAEGATFYLKIYLYPEEGDRLRGFFRGTFFGRSKARAEWENLGILADLGVDVPSRVAWGEDRRRGFLHGCFLVTQAVERAQRLDSCLADAKALPVVEDLGRLVRRMHDAGYSDGSLALRNFLYRREGAVFFKIDCPKGRRGSRLGAGARIQDLGVLIAGLNLTVGQEGLDAFFRGYDYPGSGEKKAAAFQRKLIAYASTLEEDEKKRLADPGGGRP